MNKTSIAVLFLPVALFLGCDSSDKGGFKPSPAYPEAANKDDWKNVPVQPPGDLAPSR